MIFTVFALRS